MQTFSLVIGVLAGLLMLVGFVPCFGALNWLNIPFAGIGLLIAIIAFATTEGQKKSPSIAAMVICGIAMVFGIIRLIVGGGVL